MNDSTQLGDLLASARQVWQPDAAARERVRSAVLVRVGVAAAAGTSVAASATSATAAGGAHIGSGIAVKLLVSIAIVGGVGTAGYVAATGPAPQARPVPSIAAPRAESAPTRRIAAVEPAVAARVEEPAVESLELPRARAGRDEPKTAVPASTLAEELAILRAAMRSADGGDPNAALARASEYDAKFPGGELRPEIAAVRIKALCALGRDRQAARSAQRFLDTWPESPLADGVRGACARAGGAE